jgi:hypothetical protein
MDAGKIERVDGDETILDGIVQDAPGNSLFLCHSASSQVMYGSTDDTKRNKTKNVRNIDSTNEGADGRQFWRVNVLSHFEWKPGGGAPDP